MDEYIQHDKQNSIKYFHFLSTDTYSQPMHNYHLNLIKDAQADDPELPLPHS